MRIIPVLDLKGGQAVHAVAGHRTRYQPLRSVFAPTADPIHLARGLRDEFGATAIYVADLDAIVGRVAPALATFRSLADLGLSVWADAGIEGDSSVDPLLDSGVGRIVAGSETIGGPESLRGVVEQAGSDRVILSLDLRDGVPIVAGGSTWRGDQTDPANLVDQAVQAGVRAILRLDLATVGTGRGVASIPPAPAAWPGVDWITGGGVASPADLAVLAGLGYSAVLVGSAVHDGRIKGRSVSDRRTS